MDTEQALLRAIGTDPGDATAWLALADWLEEQGEARAEVLRLWLALRREPEGPLRPEREERVQALLASGVRPCGPEVVNSLGVRLALVPAGKFLMGSPPEESGRDDDEGPVHEVEITRPFYLGVFPITQEQFERVTGGNPSAFARRGRSARSVGRLSTRTFPVECVSWREASDFCRELSSWPEEARAGRRYRLPTEAEWEYACRAAGTSSAPFHLGRSLCSTQANFDGGFPYEAQRGPYLRRTSAAGSYPPNALGLFDLHGNIWEWCSDWYEADYYTRSPPADPTGPAQGEQRVLRGGAWFFRGVMCRSARRYQCGPREAGDIFGFRVALTIER
jgi:uncharacterized protein (TIGR02996 family)